MKKKTFSLLVVDLSTSSQSIGGRIIPLACYFSSGDHQVSLLVNGAAKRTISGLSKLGKRISVEIFPFSDYFPTGRFLIGLEYLKKIVLSPFARVNKNINVVYSLTGIMCDVVPAYIIKKRIDGFWVANIDNIERPPSRKPGSYLINLFAYLIFRVSLFFLKYADLIFVTAPLKEIRQTLIKGGVKPEKIVLSNNGIPLELIRQIKDNRKKAYGASFIGRINERKGIFDLVKIWAMVLNKLPEAGKLLIIGSGDEETTIKLKRLIGEKKLTDKIILAGFVSDRKKKYRFLKDSKIFLFPSYYEANPIVTVEALACRLPIVTYNLPIFVKHYPKDLLQIVPQGDIKSFLARTLVILENDEKRRELGERGWRFAKKSSWPEIFKKQEKAIADLITPAPERPRL